MTDPTRMLAALDPRNAQISTVDRETASSARCPQNTQSLSPDSVSLFVVVLRVVLTPHHQRIKDGLPKCLITKLSFVPRSQGDRHAANPLPL